MNEWEKDLRPCQANHLCTGRSVLRAWKPASEYAGCVGLDISKDNQPMPGQTLLGILLYLAQPREDVQRNDGKIVLMMTYAH